VVVGDFNTPLTLFNMSSRLKKINIETLQLNETINQKKHTGIYGTFHPATVQYTAAHGTISTK
jgi:hypothetical protein